MNFFFLLLIGTTFTYQTKNDILNIYKLNPQEAKIILGEMEWSLYENKYYKNNKK